MTDARMKYAGQHAYVATGDYRVSAIGALLLGLLIGAVLAGAVYGVG